ncbi:bifunctional MaoC family dehydratase N-terminal/OB-fold nucleic acid binding domain-containing protein [Rhodococcus sp. 1168]|uniref:bifunctional MaoC family dehydratase N-terminal/OB-fold nucleic acid binding domain-containing protein n=1 Tax=Rhodococcus sp. 1168 TaxID=2018041 RepID=UPI000A0E0E8E|nr:OB-fold domain-containing protein [Rhodococcus sp. 1168]ORI19306.1 DNA-binding protein [Rhodococcus sp. 1168]
MSESIEEAADRIAAAGECAPRAGRDPINQPMINNWVEAIGDANPIYVDAGAAREAGHRGVVAPPAMAQVWTMGGLHYTRSSDDPLGLMMGILDDAGFTSVVATNCDQTYHRYLTLGEEVTVTTKLDNVVGPKKTGLGLGWFVTTRNIWYVGDEAVAEMVFRVLKFAPEAKPTAEDTSEAIRPVVSQETEFFWEGARVGELRIQRVEDGSLRHPPIPAIWQDKAAPIDYVVASGKGTVFSFVVHHAPKVPGRTLPFVVALVELDEGVRVLGELRGIEPSEVTVGLPVEVEFLRIDENFTLPAWKAVR